MNLSFRSKPRRSISIWPSQTFHVFWKNSSVTPSTLDWDWRGWRDIGDLGSWVPFLTSKEQEATCPGPRTNSSRIQGNVSEWSFSTTGNEQSRRMRWVVFMNSGFIFATYFILQPSSLALSVQEFHLVQIAGSQGNCYRSANNRIAPD